MSKYTELIKQAASGAPVGSFEWIERRPSLQNEVNKVYDDAVPGALSALRTKFNVPEPSFDTAPSGVYNNLALWGQLANQEGKYTGGPWAGAAYRWVDSLGDIHNTTKGVKDTLKEVLDDYALKRTAEEAFTKQLPSAHALKQFKDINNKISKKTFLNNLFLKNAPTTVGGIMGGRYASGGKYKTKTDKLKYLLGDWVGGGVLSKLFSGWHQSNAKAISDSAADANKKLDRYVGRQHVKNTDPGKIKALDGKRLRLEAIKKEEKELKKEVAEYRKRRAFLDKLTGTNLSDYFGGYREMDDAIQATLSENIENGAYSVDGSEPKTKYVPYTHEKYDPKKYSTDPKDIIDNVLQGTNTDDLAKRIADGDYNLDPNQPNNLIEAAKQLADKDSRQQNSGNIYSLLDDLAEGNYSVNGRVLENKKTEFDVNKLLRRLKKKQYSIDSGPAPIDDAVKSFIQNEENAKRNKKTRRKIMQQPLLKQAPKIIRDLLPNA